MRYDALVIGGGPAGATAALMLARAGWSVAVVEGRPFPRKKVCGEFISGTSMPLLRELGLDAAYAAEAGPEIRRVGLFAGDTVLSSAMPRPRASAGFGRALARERLDLLLLEAAQRAGAACWQPWRAVGLRREGRGHVCTIAARDRRHELRAAIAVAASGSWESNAFASAGTPPHRASDLLGFKAHFRDADLPGELMPLLVFAGGYGGMVRSSQGRVSLSCCIRRDALAACRAGTDGSAGEAVLAHVRGGCRGVRDTLRNARPDGAWLAAGPIRPGIRPRYEGGVFRTGNLAGEAHPIVAEGISMAMQASWLLCRLLLARADDVLAGRGQDEVASAYEAQWRTAFAARIHAASVFARLLMRPGAAALLLPVLQRFPAALTLGAALSGKTRGVVTAA